MLFADPSGIGDMVLNPFEPDSVKWSLLGEVQKDYDANQLVRSLITDQPGSDRSWTEYARTSAVAVVQQGTMIHNVGNDVDSDGAAARTGFTRYAKVAQVFSNTDRRVGTLLRRSGSYLRVFERGSPVDYPDGIEDVAADWRQRIEETTELVDMNGLRSALPEGVVKG